MEQIKIMVNINATLNLTKSKVLLGATQGHDKGSYAALQYWCYYRTVQRETFSPVLFPPISPASSVDEF